VTRQMELQLHWKSSAGSKVTNNEGPSRRGWVSQIQVTAHSPAPCWVPDKSNSRMGDFEYVGGLPSELPDDRPPTLPLCTGEAWAGMGRTPW